MVQSKFCSFFSIGEGNKIVAKDANANQIYSRANTGNVVDFDEALQSIVEAYPYKGSILRDRAHPAAVRKAAAAGHGGKRTVTRAAFNEMDAAEQAKVAKAAGAKELVIVD